MVGSPDFVKSHTVGTLIEFAKRFPRDPYLVFRGTFYSPFFCGPSETPCYRRHRSLSDKGEIVTTWPNGREFKSTRERDCACVLDAAHGAEDDPTLGEVLATLREQQERLSGPITGILRAGFSPPDTGTLAYDQHNASVGPCRPPTACSAALRAPA